MGSERNAFPQDVEAPERTSPRRNWFCENVGMLATALVGALSFALFVYIMAVHDPLGFGYNVNEPFNQSRPLLIKVSSNFTDRSVTMATTVPTTFNGSENPSTDNWITSKAWSSATEATIPTTVQTTVLTEVPTDVTTVLPTEPSTTVKATVPTVVTTTTVSALTTVEPSTITTVPTVPTVQETSTLAPPPSTTVISPRSVPVNFHDSGSYVAEDDEFDRPWLMGRAPWNMCVPRFQTLFDFTDMTWMCSKCHQDIRDGLYEVEIFVELHFEHLCFKMCFITVDFENCAIHLNRTQPKPSPVSARDCRFCKEQERHRKKPSRN